jgi:16S rRNA (guanine966-N2)-methyltransferase
MRIVAGKFRGKNLAKTDHLKSLRPTTDKNREALFNILSSAKFVREIGFKIIGAEVLDLCCGTGAVGFEALSRGAKFVTFVEINRDHLEIVHKNSGDLKVDKDVKIICADATKLSKNENSFDLIFIDPPYAQDYLLIMKSLLENDWVKKTSLIVVEFQANSDLANLVLPDFKMMDLRSYGKTGFGFFMIG